MAELDLKTIQKAVDKSDGNYSAASRLLADWGFSISRDTVRRRLNPELADLDHMDVVRTSTLTEHRDSDGQKLLEWQIKKPNAEKQKIMVEAMIASISKRIPREKVTAKPDRANKDLCNVYTMTDCHVGMHAWHKEGGADWDLKIAEKTLVGSFEAMVQASPMADECIIAQLGDFLHYDGLNAVTPTSGHILDADGRFSKMVDVAITILRRVVALALARHNRVFLLVAEGNHDMASSVWLRKMFQALYEDEPRVTIIANEIPFYAHQFGETMLFWHHSHLKKFEQLPLLAAAEFPEMWGKTKKRYGHTGDKHHTEEKEFSGMIVTQHPTLAARDAYASRHGWHALRRATAITYHRKYGEVSRNTVAPEMIAA